jgi:hypothetical protein
MNILPLLALATVIIALAYIREQSEEKKVVRLSNLFLNQPAFDVYDSLKEFIQNAATTSELACLENQVFEFEEFFRGQMRVQDMFVDLLTEVQARYNQLYCIKVFEATS